MLHCEPRPLVFSLLWPGPKNRPTPTKKPVSGERPMTGESRTGEFLKRSIQYPKRFCKLSRFGGPCGGIESRLKEASLEELPVDAYPEAEACIGSMARRAAPIIRGLTRSTNRNIRPIKAIIVLSAGFTKSLLGLQSRIVQRANGRLTHFWTAIGGPAVGRCEGVVGVAPATNPPNRSVHCYDLRPKDLRSRPAAVARTPIVLRQPGTANPVSEDGITRPRRFLIRYVVASLPRFAGS